MQQKHLYSLLDTSYVTILVQFGAIGRTVQQDSKPWGGQEEVSVRRPRIKGVDEGEDLRTYTYKAPKDAGIKVDDAVIVESPSNGLTVVRVVEVHDTPQIDLDASFEYKWIVQRVDRTAYDEQLNRERKFKDMMIEVERVNQREKLMNDMRANLPDGSEARKLFDQATQMVSVPYHVAGTEQSGSNQ